MRKDVQERRIEIVVKGLNPVVDDRPRLQLFQQRLRAAVPGDPVQGDPVAVRRVDAVRADVHVIAHVDLFQPVGFDQFFIHLALLHVDPAEVLIERHQIPVGRGLTAVGLRNLTLLCVDRHQTHAQKQQQHRNAPQHDGLLPLLVLHLLLVGVHDGGKHPQNERKMLPDVELDGVVDRIVDVVVGPLDVARIVEQEGQLLQRLILLDRRREVVDRTDRQVALRIFQIPDPPIGNPQRIGQNRLLVDRNLRVRILFQQHRQRRLVFTLRDQLVRDHIEVGDVVRREAHLQRIPVAVAAHQIEPPLPLEGELTAPFVENHLPRRPRIVGRNHPEITRIPSRTVARRQRIAHDPLCGVLQGRVRTVDDLIQFVDRLGVAAQLPQRLGLHQDDIAQAQDIEIVVGIVGDRARSLHGQVLARHVKPVSAVSPDRARHRAAQPVGRAALRCQNWMMPVLRVVSAKSSISSR